MDNRLAHQFKVDELPSLFTEDYTGGRLRYRKKFNGERSAHGVMNEIRELVNLHPEYIGNPERYNGIRRQVTHHVVVGYVESGDSYDEYSNILNDLQNSFITYKFMIAKDLSSLPKELH